MKLASRGGKNKAPTRRPGALEALLKGFVIPLRLDSRLPGMESKQSVSSMLLESKFLFPDLCS